MMMLMHRTHNNKTEVKAGRYVGREAGRQDLHESLLSQI